MLTLPHILMIKLSIFSVYVISITSVFLIDLVISIHDVLHALLFINTQQYRVVFTFVFSSMPLYNIVAQRGAMQFY